MSDKNFYSWMLITQFLQQGGVVSVPKDFHTRCQRVSQMVDNDESGIIRSISNFGINSACEVPFHIEAPSKALSGVLNEWLLRLNEEYIGKIPLGVRNLAQEYYKERWLGSSLCILRIIWGDFNGYILPKALWFVDGSSVYINNLDKTKNIGEQGYYFDSKFTKPISGDIIVQKPYGRWFDGYPSTYLISNGVYRNFYSLAFLKTKTEEIIKKVLPYLLTLKKGNTELFKQGVKYNDEDMKSLKESFETFMEEYRVSGDKIPLYATPFDFELSHEIPDLGKVLDPDFFQEANRSILSGLGFMDVATGSSNDRRDRVLNPKPFIAEVNAGVTGFTEMFQELMYLIALKNKSYHRNMFKDITKIKVFGGEVNLRTEAMLNHIRSGYDRGVISIQTYQEKLDINTQVEISRRDEEKKRKLDELFSPHPNQYVEVQEQVKEQVKDEDFDPEDTDRQGAESNNYIV